MGKYKFHTISHLFVNIEGSTNTKNAFSKFHGARIKRFPSTVKFMENGRVELTVSPRTAAIIDIKVDEVSEDFLYFLKNKFRGQDYRSAREHIDAWVNEFDLDLDNK